MRTNSEDFNTVNQYRGKSIRLVIEIDFSEDGTDLYYFTSNSDVPTVTPVIHGALQDTSSISQKLVPERANSSIGSLSFKLIDPDKDVTGLFNTKRASSKVLFGKRVRLYLGYEGLAWADYRVEQTQYISKKFSYKDGIYSFSCRDLQDRMNKSIMQPLETRISADVALTDTTIEAYNLTGWELVARDADFLDAPSVSVTYCEISDGTSKEYCRVTAIGANLTVVRGVLGSAARLWEIPTDASDEKGAKLKELIVIEMKSLKFAYAVLTGVLLGDSGSLPAHWHLGLDTALFTQADFENQEDFYAYAVGLEKTDGKKLIEQEIMLPNSRYFRVNGSGNLDVRRIHAIHDDSAVVFELNETEIIKHNQIDFDAAVIANKFEIDWSFDILPKKPEYRRKSTFIFADSVTDYGEHLKSFKFRLLNGIRASGSTILGIVNAFSDRFAGEGARLKVSTFARNNDLEVGDVVKVKHAAIQDFNSDAAIDRSMQIISTTVNQKKGTVDLNLFGSTFAPDPLTDGSSAVMNASFYNSTGTVLPNVTADALTVNTTLAGSADHASSIWYHLGDLTINAGVTLTIEDNVELRVRGHLTVLGDISAVGAGRTSGGGYIGTSIGKNGLNTVINGGVDALAAVQLGDINTGLFEAFPTLDLINNAGASISGVAADMRGSAGADGGDSLHESAIAEFEFSAGGNGNSSGSALMIVCRGMSLSGAGAVDMSGVAGGVATPSLPSGLITGGDAGFSTCGGLLVLLDGGTSSVPNFITRITALTNNPAITGTSIDIKRSASRTQFIPQQRTIVDDEQINENVPDVGLILNHNGTTTDNLAILPRGFSNTQVSLSVAAEFDYNGKHYVLPLDKWAVTVADAPWNDVGTFYLCYYLPDEPDGLLPPLKKGFLTGAAKTIWNSFVAFGANYTHDEVGLIAIAVFESDGVSITSAHAIVPKPISRVEAAEDSATSNAQHTGVTDPPSSGLGTDGDHYGYQPAGAGTVVTKDFVKHAGAWIEKQLIATSTNADTLDSLDSLDFVRSTGTVAQTVTGIKSFSAEINMGDGLTTDNTGVRDYIFRYGASRLYGLLFDTLVASPDINSYCFTTITGLSVFKIHANSGDTETIGAVLAGTNVTAPFMELSGLSNIAPPTDDMRVSGYGLMANRGSMYITNYHASGNIIFGNNGLHAVTQLMVLSASGLVVNGDITAVNAHITTDVNIGTANISANGTTHTKFNNTNTGAIGLQLQVNGTTRGYLYATSGNDVGFLDNSGSWKLRLQTSGVAQLYGSTTGVSNINYQQFNQSDATRDGYIGIASPSSRDMYLLADAGNVLVYSNTAAVKLYHNATLKVETGTTWEITSDGTIVTDKSLTGGYGRTGSSSTWGQTVFGMGTSFDGGVSGDSYAEGNLYGIAWLRSSHASADSNVGEGLYQMQNGVIQSAMGQYGVITPKITQSGTRGFLQVKNTGSAEVAWGALMGCSGTSGEWLFGGHASSDAAMTTYLRLGTDKFQFTSNGYSNVNVLHEGLKNANYIGMTGTATRSGNLNVYSVTSSGVYSESAIEIRELNAGSAQTGVDAEAPAMAFHWGGRVQVQLALHADGYLHVRDGTTHSTNKNLRAAIVNATTHFAAPKVTSTSGNFTVNASTGHIIINPITAGYYARLYYAGTEMFRVGATLNYSYQPIALSATKPLYFDGGGNTYIQEDVADNLRIVAGGTERFNANSSGVQMTGDITGNTTLTLQGGAKRGKQTITSSASAPTGGSDGDSHYIY